MGRPKLERTPEQKQMALLALKYPLVRVCNCAGCGKLLLGDVQPPGVKLPTKLPLIAARIKDRPYGECCAALYQRRYLEHKRRMGELGYASTMGG